MRASIQKTPRTSWAVKVDGLSANDFLSLPFGRQMADAKKVQEFKATAKTYHVGAKHRATVAAVREWIKERNPSQFFASWPSDSPQYKDDSVQVWYVD